MTANSRTPFDPAAFAPSEDHTPWTPLAMLAAALAGAIALHAWQLSRSPAICRDGVVFARYAQRLQAATHHPGGGLRAVLEAVRYQDQHPLYPALVVVMYRLTGGPDPASHEGPAPPGRDGSAPGGHSSPFSPAQVVADHWQWAARLVAMLGHLLLLPALWLVGRQLFDPFAGGLASLGAAVLPGFVHTGSDAMSDLPGLALLAWSLVFALRGLTTATPLDALACGLLGGMAYLVRPEMAQVVVALGIWRAGQIAWALTGRLAGWPQADQPRLVTVAVSMGILAHAAAAYMVPLMALRGSLLSKLANAHHANQYWSDPAAAPWGYPAFDSVRRPHLAIEPQIIAAHLSVPTPSGTNPAAADLAKPFAPQPTTSAEAHHFPLARRAYGGLRAYLGRWAHAVGWALLIWVVAGAVAQGRQLITRADLAFMITLGLLQLIYLVGALHLPAAAPGMAGRHLLPVAMLSLLWLGPGTRALGALAAALAHRWGPISSSSVSHPLLCPRATTVAAALLAIPFGLWIARAVEPVNGNKRPLVEAGAWLAAHWPTGHTVLDPLALAAFTAGADHLNALHTAHDLHLADEMLAAVFDAARHAGQPVAYVVLADEDLHGKFRCDGRLPSQLQGRDGVYTLRAVASFPRGSRGHAPRASPDSPPGDSALRIYAVAHRP